MNGATIDEKRSDEFLEQYEEDFKKSLKDYYINVLGWSQKKVDSMKFWDFGFKPGFYLANKASPDGSQHQDFHWHKDVGWFEELNLTLKFTVEREGKPYQAFHYVYDGDKYYAGPMSESDAIKMAQDLGLDYKKKETPEVKYKIKVQLQNADTGEIITGMPLSMDGKDYVEYEPGYDDFHSNPVHDWTVLVDRVNQFLIEER